MLRHKYFLACVLLLFSTEVQAQLFDGTPFDNTPFDPDTWVDTIENTPFDPQTWIDTLDDITNPGGTLCELYAKDLMSRYRSTRGLSHTEKFYLRPWFGDLVDQVFVMWGVPLNSEVRVGGSTLAVSPTAQTFGRRIYIRERRQTGSSNQLIVLAHEMCHVWQYERMGSSLQRYCRAYINGYFSNGADYFAIPMERGGYHFEIGFAGWLGHQHPGAPMVQYQTVSPYQRRIVLIPTTLRIPPQEYAQTCIENRTTLQIVYEVRSGPGQWQRSVLAPHATIRHSWAYPGGMNSSPDLFIRFNHDLSSLNKLKSYTLQRYRSTVQGCGPARKYHFDLGPGNVLDLYDSGP